MITEINLSRVTNVARTASAADLRYMAELAAERERLLHNDPLNYGFTPHAGQLAIHKSTADEVFLVAANRWGKSVTGMREVLWRATGSHPYKQIRPHRVIWCGFVDFGFYIKVTKRIFDEWAPKNSLIQFHDSEKWAKFKRKDGGTCTIYFLSYESGRMSWQGAGVDYIWLDEELPQEIYQEALARLVDRHGQILLTQTPVTGLNWAYDEIYLPAVTGTGRAHVIQGALATKDESAPYGVGEPLVPHLTKEQIVRLAQTYRDPDERAIRVFGEFRGRTGGVYKSYDPEVHVIPGFKIPKYYEVWGGVDPGYHGFAAVCFAQDPTGRIYVPLEFFSQQENHTTRVTELWAKLQQVFEIDPDEYFVFYCDTANPQDILELNSWAMQAGTRMVFASLDHGKKAREAGIQRVNEFLYPVPSRSTPPEVQRPKPPKGEPLLYFFDNLHSNWAEEEERIDTSRLLWEMVRYTWKKARKTEAHPVDADDKSAGGAHALAAFRYGIMGRVGAPEEPEGPDPREGWDPFVRRHMEQLEERLVVARAEDATDLVA